MYAEPFDYAEARSWDEAVDLLRKNGDEARVIAGGQSLIPMMTLRLAMPAFLVDVNGADRSRIERQGDRITISAVTRHAEIERSPGLATDCPMLAEAASLVGNIRVRHRGTIGGSLAHADPAAELPCAAVALGGEILTLGPDGERRIAAGEFFDSFFTTALQPGEVITGVEVPTMPERTGWSFLELLRRTSDFAVVALGALVTLDGKGVCTGAKVAAAGVGGRPVDLSHAAEALLGQPVGDTSVAEAGRRAAAAVEPPAAAHASSEYRRGMLEVMVRRALVQAAGRARGGSG